MSAANRPRSKATKRSAPKPRQAPARRSGTASVRVYEVLRGQILRGELAPGTHLSQQTLAASMQTSNGPVISALRRLAHDGLVSYERGRGCRVGHWDEDKQEDLLIVRRALETEAARLASRRAGPEDLEGLRRIVDRMTQVVRQGRRDEADALDVELHESIARLSRSPSLIEALQRCHVLELVRRRLATHGPTGDFDNLAVNHGLLVEAIASGDPEAAGHAMHNHLASRRLRNGSSHAGRNGQRT